MNSKTKFAALASAVALCGIAAPAQAFSDARTDSFTVEETDLDRTGSAVSSETIEAPEATVQSERPSAPARPGQPFRPVFDDTWATIGIGAGLVPSYTGSDDYILFPLPLVRGRVGGVGISPNGPGFNLDLLSKPPAFGERKTQFSFGPSFRFRNDRANQVEDAVVELAEDLDVAVEVGLNAGVSIPGVFSAQDTLSFNAQLRWDILDAHNGMLFEPSIGYFVPLDRGTALQVSVNASFVDDDFADYYFTVTPEQSAATGLPQFTADGGLNSLGTLAILSVDLDGNSLNGGFSIYTIAGYTRLVGDGEDTPFTAIRGDANQLFGGLGVSYTF